MIDRLPQLPAERSHALEPLLHHLRSLETSFLGRSELISHLDGFLQTEAGSALRGTPAESVLRSSHEAVVDGPSVYLAVRSRVAHWAYARIHAEDFTPREISVEEYLAAKEGVVENGHRGMGLPLELDLEPFERGFPRISDPSSIGQGARLLSKDLSARVCSGAEEGKSQLLEFLRTRAHQGTQLMVNGRIADAQDLRSALRKASALLSARKDDGGWEAHGPELRRLGFEPGWGGSTDRILETMELLSTILEGSSAAAPEPDRGDDPEAGSPGALDEFLSRIPTVFSVAILSPHGFFGQADVLGKPDTGGQVVYILDQVRALEREMRESLRQQGLEVEPQIVVLSRLIPEAGGTTCDQPLEPIHGTRRARILRVPFRDQEGEILQEWVSRFDIWPYLESYALEAEEALVAELGGKPDFILGNYSDGNLVASIMARRMGVVQCNIAHALEKTKYENSDLYWNGQYDEFHFSCQFTADLYSMNTADFIITSTYQEIAGTEETVGQYESYQAFTLPGLVRVVSGIDAFDPKFNIVSPGADPEIFFPFSEPWRRESDVQDAITGLVFGKPGSASRGSLEDRDKPILFAMSRLDRIKNMGGFLGWYARNPELRKVANVLLVGGEVDPDLSSDRDERLQIEEMHRLFDEHGLEEQVRWVQMQTDKNRVGELYRTVADTRGAFVQPALFEGFGLTVVEAMSSGLPVFATRFGGPLEVVEHGRSGFHIDPTHGEAATRLMVDFFHRTRENPGHWDELSRNAIARVEAGYNWGLYARKLLSLTRVYGFWKHLTGVQREGVHRYLDMIFGLLYRPLAETLGNGGS